MTDFGSELKGLLVARHRSVALNPDSLRRTRHATVVWLGIMQTLNTINIFVQFSIKKFFASQFLYKAHFKLFSKTFNYF
jgi:uncharacterized membrane protein